MLLPGDGVGPEVTREARLLLEQLAPDCAPFEISEADFGGAAIDEHGTPLPADTLERALSADAVLLGAVGLPKHDSLPQDSKPEAGLLGLRAQMGVFANLRPAKARPALVASSPLRPELAAGLDLLIIRELVGGVYFGEPRGLRGEGERREGFNTMRYCVAEVKRIGKAGFAAAADRTGRLCSVDKANVLDVSRLWRDTMEALAADHPGVQLRSMLVDNAAMQLVTDPAQFDVIVTGNLFGDILSDIASALCGSIGMAPSASLDEKGRGLYEPVHGSAPDLAGRDRANPCAAMLSAAMLLRHSLGEQAAAERVERAVDAAIEDGLRTDDIAAGGPSISCQKMGAAVRARL